MDDRHVLLENMRAQKIEALKRAFEAYLIDGDTAALVETVRYNRCRPPQNASYPERHRICDFRHGSMDYRVTRLVADGSEQIFIQPTDFADPSSTGVPYGLQGPQLRRWIDDAADKQARELKPGEVDWSHYLTAEPSCESQEAGPAGGDGQLS